MTPAARIAAAIEIIDAQLAGEAAEKVLTNWARRNRYAGSTDRAVIRDHVFSALRNLRSYSALGGALTGRGVMIGMIRSEGRDPDEVFSGEGYAPSPLTDAERAHQVSDLSPAERLDCQDWLFDVFEESLADGAVEVLKALKQRAPVFLRVNHRKATVAEARAALKAADIDTRTTPLSDSALEVVRNPRKVANSAPFKDGWVELQDVASQWVTQMIPLDESMRVLDYCAGGGGKTLALAGRANAKFFAHDAIPRRMSDLPLRAARADVRVTCLDTDEVVSLAPYDVVVCDVPCSGSGAWRRSPEGKWLLTEDRLNELIDEQAAILRKCEPLVAPGGVLCYITCSLFSRENEKQIDGFTGSHPAWSVDYSGNMTPLNGGDGMFVAIMRRRDP